jgi:tetratricopeptide (TPR) repeat protein
MCKSAPSFSALSRVLLLAALIANGFISARADEKPRPQLSEATGEKLQELAPLENEKKWDEAEALVDSLLATVDPTSYDRAVLSEIKVGYLFKENKQLETISLLETALNLSDTYGYFEVKDAQKMRYPLARLYYERGVTSKDPAAQLADYEKACATIEKWLQVNNTDPTASHASTDTLTSAEIFYAQLLFTMAEIDQKHVNIDLIKKALGEIETGLRSTPRPSDDFYVLELAALQRLGDYPSAADVLEHVLKSKPDNKPYWQELVAFYEIMAGNAAKDNDEQKAREYNIRAILSIERAQQHGTLTTPEDNYTLVGIYFNVGQYGQAADLLENGLHNGTIKSTPPNWMLLANAYQELHQQLQAVDVLHEASDLFPNTGQFDYLASQILYGLNKTSEALTAIQSCVAKDGGEKPGQSWLFLSYLAYELQKYDLAKQAAENAVKDPHISPTDASQAKRLGDAADNAIQQRAAALHTTN